MQDSYRYWSVQLQRFADGDDAALEDLASAELSWQSGVAERIARRISHAFTTRLEEVRRRMQRDLDHPTVEVAAISQALIRGRGGLRPLVHLSQLASLPEEVREHLDSELRRVVTDLQTSLERSIRADNDLSVRILAELRRHRLTAVFEQPAAGTPTQTPDGAATPVRSLIL